MSMAANALLDRVFEHISADSELQKLYHKHAGPRRRLPRISFDFIETQPVEQIADLERHRLQFSIWADLHAMAEILDWGHKMRSHFDNLDAPENYHLVEFRVLQQNLSPDYGDRLWRYEIQYEALTEPR